MNTLQFFFPFCWLQIVVGDLFDQMIQFGVDLTVSGVGEPHSPHSKDFIFYIFDFV